MGSLNLKFTVVIKASYLCLKVVNSYGILGFPLFEAAAATGFAYGLFLGLLLGVAAVLTAFVVFLMGASTICLCLL